MKLSHAASRLRTAIAELRRAIGVGSGALLGVMVLFSSIHASFNLLDERRQTSQSLADFLWRESRIGNNLGHLHALDNKYGKRLNLHICASRFSNRLRLLPAMLEMSQSQLQAKLANMPLTFELGVANGDKPSRNGTNRNAAQSENACDDRSVAHSIIGGCVGLVVGVLFISLPIGLIMRRQMTPNV